MKRDQIIIKITVGDVMDYITSDYMLRTSVGIVSEEDIEYIAEQVWEVIADGSIDVNEMIISALVDYTAVMKVRNKCSRCDSKMTCKSYSRESMNGDQIASIFCFSPTEVKE